jgi:hypothetical protein
VNRLSHNLGAWYLLLAMFVAPGAMAETFSGQVIAEDDGQAVAGVEIEVILSGEARTLARTTDADGRFEARLRDLFSNPALDTEFIAMRLRKPGFLTYVFTRRTRERGVFGIDGVVIRLERDDASSAPDPALGGREGPRRIFHRDYALFAVDDDAAARLDQLNARLPRHLRRGIITHLQGLSLPADVTLDALPEAMQAADSVARRRFAVEQDALAVIEGEAELVDDNGEAVVEMVSEFRIVPQLPALRPGTLHVDDVIPADRIRPSQLSRQLSRAWGSTTVFAIALQETRKALAEPDPAQRRQRLELAQRFLKAQQRDLPGDDILRQQFVELAAIIEEALAP